MKQRQKYSEEFHEFMKKITEGHSTAEISQLIFDRFGLRLSATQIRNYKKNHGLLSNIHGGFKKGFSFIFSEEVIAFINNNYQNIGTVELTEKINKKFNTNYSAQQIKTYKDNHGLKSGFSTHFKKGNIPKNKGQKMSEDVYKKVSATFFRTGNIPHNHVPVGTEVLATIGYWKVKIGEPDKWAFKHILIWEKENGPVPKNHKIIFLDGDKNNLSISNLACVTNDELLYLNRKNLITQSSEITKVAVSVARLQTTISKKLKAGLTERINNAGQI